MSGTTMEQNKGGLGLGGFVLAIIGLVLAFIPSLHIAAIIFSAIGCVFSLMGIYMTTSKSAKAWHGISIAGVVIAIVGLIVSVAATISYTEAHSKSADDVSSQIQRSVVIKDAKTVEITATVQHTGTADVTINGVSSKHAFDKTYTQKITGEDAKKPVTVKVMGDMNDPDDQTVACSVTVNGKQVSQKKAKGDNPAVTCSSIDMNK